METRGIEPRTSCLQKSRPGRHLLSLNACVAHLVGLVHDWCWGRCRTFLEYGPLAPSMVTRVADGPEHCPVMAQETCSQPSTETLHSLWDDGLTHDFWSHAKAANFEAVSSLKVRLRPRSSSPVLRPCR